MSKPGDWKKSMMETETRVQKERRVPVAPSPVKLPVEAQTVIARELRERYDALLADPLPERLSKLLDELSKSEENK